MHASAGSSACSNGRFYCQNKGHESTMLSASFVDDGICDCCDGSDELRGCYNTCLEKSQGKLVELQAKVAAYGSTLAKKASYIDLAAARRREWSARALAIDADIQAKLSFVEAARADKAKAEQANAARVQEETAARQAEEERRRAKAEEQERMRQKQDEAEIQQEQHEVQQSSEGSAASSEDETAEERGRRIASQWTSDPDAAAAVEGEDEPEESDVDPDNQEEYEQPLPRVQARKKLSEWEEFMLFAKLVSRWLQGWVDWFKMVFREGIARDVRERRQAATLNRRQRYAHLNKERNQSPPQQQEPARQAAEISEELREATAKLVGLEAELEALNKEKKDMTQFQASSYDYGPGEIFFPYAGRCFTDRGARWTFEACFFDNAYQSEAHSSSNRVNLGAWRGFAEQYKIAIFDGGDPCANAPARSLRVRLVCGHDEILYSSSEPSTCVYDSYLATPVVCTEEELLELQAQLSQLQALQAEVQAEIDATRAPHDEL